MLVDNWEKQCIAVMILYHRVVQNVGAQVALRKMARLK